MSLSGRIKATASDKRGGGGYDERLQREKQSNEENDTVQLLKMDHCLKEMFQPSRLI